MTRQTYAALLAIDLLMLCLVWWLINTDPARRARDQAAGWATITRLCWRAASRIGRWAINAELKSRHALEYPK